MSLRALAAAAGAFGKLQTLHNSRVLGVLAWPRVTHLEPAPASAPRGPAASAHGARRRQPAFHRCRHRRVRVRGSEWGKKDKKNRKLEEEAAGGISDLKTQCDDNLVWRV